MVDTPIVNEALQKDFRDNFPSQISSGRDLHVSDVIVPVVDFSTSTAVTGLGTSLQQALDFNVTAFNVENTTTSVVSTPGFYKVFVTFSSFPVAGSVEARAQLTDGVTTKILLEQNVNHSSSSNFHAINYEFIVFLKTGISLQMFSDSVNMKVTGSLRQLADISGTLVNPDGYTGS